MRSRDGGWRATCVGLAATILSGLAAAPAAAGEVEDFLGDESTWVFDAGGEGAGGASAETAAEAPAVGLDTEGGVVAETTPADTAVAVVVAETVVSAGENLVLSARPLVDEIEAGDLIAEVSADASAGDRRPVVAEPRRVRRGVAEFAVEIPRAWPAGPATLTVRAGRTGAVLAVRKIEVRERR